jgi:xanthine dehydrogenase molybdopterin-binding subunit B
VSHHCDLFLKTRSSSDHRLLSNGTWDLKIPSVMDIPVAFNVTLTQSASTSPYNILGSKCATEPGMVLAASAFFALKQAIYAARKLFALILIDSHSSTHLVYLRAKWGFGQCLGQNGPPGHPRSGA